MSDIVASEAGADPNMHRTPPLCPAGAETVSPPHSPPLPRQETFSSASRAPTSATLAPEDRGAVPVDTPKGGTGGAPVSQQDPRGDANPKTPTALAYGGSPYRPSTGLFNQETGSPAPEPVEDLHGMPSSAEAVPVPMVQEGNGEARLDSVSDGPARGSEPAQALRYSAWVQFMALVQRTLRQKRRQAVSTFFETLIPVVFALVLLALCLGFQEATGPTNSLNDSRMMTGDLYKLVFCSEDAPDTRPIDGLYPCAQLKTLMSHALGPEEAAKGYLQSCSSLEETPTIPVKGLCIFAMKGALGIMGFNKTDDVDAIPASNLWRMWVSQYLSQIQGQAIGLQDLNMVIVTQWAAEVAFGNLSHEVSPLLQFVASVGIGTSSDSRINSIMSNGKLYFAPRDKIPTDLIDHLKAKSSLLQYVYGGVFDTVENAKASIQHSDTPTWALVTVHDLENGFDVDIALDKSSLPSIPTVINPNFNGAYQYNTADMYLASGLVYLQKCLYDYYIHNLEEKGHFKSTYTTSDKYPFVVTPNTLSTHRNRVVQQAGPMVSFVAVMAFLYPFMQMVKSVALERELHIREASSIMGLRRLPMYLSYVFLHTLQGSVTVSIFALVILFGVARTSNYFILWLIFEIFYLSLIPLSALVAACFGSARFATQMAPIIYFFTTMPIFLIGMAPTALKLVLSLVSPTAVALLYTDFVQFGMGGGFDWDSFSFVYLTPKPMAYIIFLSADVVLYFLLMLYVDYVTPGNYGPAHHPLFFVVEPFRAFRRCLRGGRACADEGPREADAADDDAELFEPREPRTRRVVEMDGLVKVFERGGKAFRAVDDLRWSMHDCEISVLLGENGAGKSTSVNMLTGMEEMDAGDCRVDGFSVRRQLSAVRQRLGYCPQHNVLWPDLTCREHLEFFGKVKGLAGAVLETRVLEVLEMVDLVDKADALSSHLSGGQKRKLSVAIAFVGDNSLVILDEPTAGMDAAARRHTWQLLRLMSSQCAILLTTHFLDEADLLGDYIGIMQAGRLRCSGSSLYLKSKLGRGYTLTVELERGDPHDAIGAELRGPLQDVVTLSENAREKLYSVPKSSFRGMPAALRVLETRGTALGVRGFAVSATTLEEVFLTVVERAVKEKESDSSSSVSSHYESGAEQISEETGGGSPGGEISPSQKGLTSALPSRGEGTSPSAVKNDLRLVWNCTTQDSILVQFKAMLQKKFRNALRDRRLLAFQIICPVVAACIAMLLQLIDVPTTSFVEYTMEMFKQKTIVPYGSDCLHLLGDARRWDLSAPPVLHAVKDTLYFEGMMNYLAETYYDHPQFRLSAYQCDNGPEVTHYPIIGDSNFYALVYNSSSTPAVVLTVMQFYQQVVTQGMMTAGISMGEAVGKPFSFSSSLLPKNKFSRSNSKSSVSAVMVSLILVIPFTFLPAMPAGWVVKERECKARHMQRLAGLSNAVYWLGNFLFDMLCYLVTEVLVILILVIFRRTSFVGAGTFLPFALGLLLFGISSTVIAYFVAFFFTEHTAAQHVLASLSFATGFILLIVVSVIDILAEGGEWAKQVRMACRIFPSFCVGDVFLNLAYLDIGAYPGLTPWSMDIVGWPCVFMACEIPLYVLLIVLVEHPLRTYYLEKIGRRMLRCCCPTLISGDDDVESELYQVAPSTEGGRVNAGHPVSHPRSFSGMGGISPIHGSSSPAGARHQHTRTMSRTFLSEPPPTSSCQTPSALRQQQQSQANTLMHHRGPSNVSYHSPSLRHQPYPSFGASATSLTSPATPPLGSSHHARLASFGTSRLSPHHSRGLTQSHFYSHRHEESVVNLGRHGELLRLNGEDSDVEEERQAVRQDVVLRLRQDPVQVVNARKVYASGVVAVRSLSFSVMRGEVFALLGTNGSGKTTTMSMLCQEQAPTRGKMFVDGHNTVRESVAARQRIGYCPQFDATLDLLTVEEHLQLYADIHGVIPQQRSDVVERLLVVCGLMPFRDVLSKDLSGGNRRKLSVAVCLIGGPSVVCLDEPSAGMDPMARRKLWESILTIAKECSVLLTTHHMEEVEALANCVGIMSRGTLRCLGDLHHLKRKYGSGYEVSLRVNRAGRQDTWGTAEDEVEEFVACAFPGSVINECFRGERYVLSLPAEGTVLSTVFQVLQENQEPLGITDFIVSQTTIEQVFLRFCGTCSEEELNGSMAVLPIPAVTGTHALQQERQHVAERRRCA